MKKVYESPRMVVEQFEANEYIAACGDENKVYKFTCDAGNKSNRYHVYLNGADGMAHTSDDIDWSNRYSWWGNDNIRTYHPCGTTHEAKVDSDFQKGYMYRYSMGSDVGNAIDVIVWKGLDGDNTHCTTNLDMKSWETAKS